MIKCPYQFFYQSINNQSYELYLISEYIFHNLIFIDRVDIKYKEFILIILIAHKKIPKVDPFF